MRVAMRQHPPALMLIGAPAMYLQNKYARIYFSIIDNAKQRKIDSYTEVHHILPKSLGGSNSKDNLVNLTAREHYICHLLLTKMVESTFKNKMVYALWMMIRGNSKQKRNFKINSKIYSKLKTEYAESVRNSKLGKKLSEETKLKISQKKKGVPLKIKGKSEKWYEAHSRTHKGKSNNERKRLNTTSDCTIER